MSGERAHAMEIHRFSADGPIPNNADLPVVIHRGVLRAEPDRATRFERLFASNGWTNGWRDGLYDFHHFHSTAHEALGVARGTATVLIGGPSGLAIELEAGDVLILPAGTGHKREAASADFLLVGAYADGRDWDICRGEPDQLARVLDNIGAVPKPRRDPVLGAAGPLVQSDG